MRRLHLLLVTVTTAFGAAGVIALDNLIPRPRYEGRISLYRRWTKVTPGRLYMKPEVDVRCKNTPWDYPPNPHVPKYFNVYVNPLGRAAMLSKKSATFPVGSIIVKEKFAGKGARSPELLTIMIKHPVGYDRAHGDWEFLATDGAGRLSAKPQSVRHCQSCHDGVRGNDYAYRVYVAGFSLPSRPLVRWMRDRRTGWATGKKSRS